MTYNNQFYIPELTNDKVYIYSSTGAYQSNFNLHSDNGSPAGITTYNNQFYIS